MHNVMWTRAALLTYLYQLGEWDELLRESDELVRWDREHGGTQIEISALTVGAAALAQRGRLDEAARDVAIFLPRAREIGDPQAVVPALIQAALVLGAARATRRRSLARGGVRELCGSRKSRRSRGAPCRHSDLRRRGAAEVAERLVQAASGATGPVARSALASSRALLCEARGEVAEAASLYREGAAGWAEWGSVVENAYALLGLGRCCRRRGRTTRGRGRLRASRRRALCRARGVGQQQV